MNILKFIESITTTFLTEVIKSKYSNRRETIKDAKNKSPRILYDKINQITLRNYVEKYKFKLKGELEIEYDTKDEEGIKVDNIILKGFIKENFEIEENEEYVIIGIINSDELIEIKGMTAIENKPVNFREKSSIVIWNNENIAFIVKDKHNIKRITFLGNNWRSYIDLSYNEFLQGIPVKNIDIFR